MNALLRFLSRRFPALVGRSFRLFLTGQAISLAGTWMQRVAQSWLVLEMTGSGTAIGGVTSLQFLPLLLLAPVTGYIADRFDKKRVLLLSQVISALLAVLLGALVLLDLVELWMVFALAFTLGIVSGFENPARHAFVMEMVGRNQLANAVAINSMVMSISRVVGPAIAGLLIVVVGVGICFLVNALTFLVFITALLLIRENDLTRSDSVPQPRGYLKTSASTIVADPRLYVPLIMSVVVGLFSHEFEVILPLMARFTFSGDADTFGLMFASVGIGSAVGGLRSAVRHGDSTLSLDRSAVILGIAMAAAAVAPLLWIEMAVLVVVGAASTIFSIDSNVMLQLASPTNMRGQVLALRAAAFLGARPVGAPILGWIGEHVGPRYAMGLGAVTAASAGIWATARLARRDNRSLGRLAEESPP